MKNILVTGGTGYIGCHTCLNLLERKLLRFYTVYFNNLNMT